MVPEAVQDDLRDVATRLLVGHGATATAAGRPVWLELRAGPDGDLDEVMVESEAGLLGMTADPSSFAVGVVAGARLRRLDESVEVPTLLRGGLQGGVRLACVMARTGRIGWHMVLPDGSPFDQPPDEGRMLDTMLRSLGLATAPPPRPISLLETAAWLATLLAVTSDQRRLTWRQAVAVHPAVLAAFGRSPQGWPVFNVERSACGRGGGETPEGWDPEEAVRTAGASGEWEQLRLAAARGAAPWIALEPELAEWMDEGMFARWILDGLISVEEMVAAARSCLVPSGARRMAHLLRRMGGA
jgi:hypothetical protein